MPKALVSDFSRVILLPVDGTYTGGLNPLHRTLSEQGPYDFFAYFKLNTELLDFYKSIVTLLPLYVLTEGTIQEHPALQEHLQGIFREIFSCSRLGKKKDDPDSYRWIAEHIGVAPHEILYIDDLASNIDTARKAGMIGIQHISNEDVIRQIQAAMQLHITKIV